MPGEMRPYSRSEYNRALVVNALTQPFNVCLLAGIVIAGLLLDLLLPLLAVGIVVYGIAVARTYFDEDEANKVLERERARAPQANSRRAASTRASSPRRSPAS